MDTPRRPEPFDDDLDLTLDELAQRVGTSTRTVRFYIAQGLLPGPGARGKAASYGAEHLVRLRLIRLLSARHLPLAEIQALLRNLSLGEARDLLAAEEKRSGEMRAAEGRQSPRDYVSALLEDARHVRRGRPARPHKADANVPLAARPAPGREERRRFEVPRAASAPQRTESWARWVLAPGVELHVQADAREPQRALIRRLLLAASAQDDDGDEDDAGDQ
jgi:DNA-binding transcriptional MerR regulator